MIETSVNKGGSGGCVNIRDSHHHHLTLTLTGGKHLTSNLTPAVMDGKEGQSRLGGSCHASPPAPNYLLAAHHYHLPTIAHHYRCLSPALFPTHTPALSRPQGTANWHLQLPPRYTIKDGSRVSVLMISLLSACCSADITARFTTDIRFTGSRALSLKQSRIEERGKLQQNVTRV